MFPGHGFTIVKCQLPLLRVVMASSLWFQLQKHRALISPSSLFFISASYSLEHTWSVSVCIYQVIQFLHTFAASWLMGSLHGKKRRITIIIRFPIEFLTLRRQRFFSGLSTVQLPYSSGDVSGRFTGWSDTTNKRSGQAACLSAFNWVAFFFSRYLTWALNCAAMRRWILTKVRRRQMFP